MRGLRPHHHRHIDAAGIIAGSGIFLPVAIADHLEQIAIFERLERCEIVDLLKAQNVRARCGNGQRRQLAGVIRQRNGAGLFKRTVMRLVLDLIERERAIPAQIIAETGEIEPVHQVFDVECGKAEGHASTFNRHGDEYKPAFLRTRLATVSFITRSWWI